MIKIAICGIGGRMGGRIAHLTLESDDLEMSGGVEAAGHAHLGHDIGEVIGVPRLGVHVVENLETIVAQTDVVVAFTAPPGGTLDAAKVAGIHRKPMVVGTTGLSPNQVQTMKDSLSKVPCVFAPSFSVGVTVLIQLVEEAARVMGDDYDVEIVEAHHHFKTDAPSGTALAMARAAAAGLGRNLDDVALYGRHGNVGARTKKEIGIHAVRAGDLAGEHTVMFGGLGETISFVHRAQSRDTYASGALRAVRFVTKAAPGMYDMRHVLGMV